MHGEIRRTPNEINDGEREGNLTVTRLRQTDRETTRKTAGELQRHGLNRPCRSRCCAPAENPVAGWRTPHRRCGLTGEAGGHVGGTEGRKMANGATTPRQSMEIEPRLTHAKCWARIALCSKRPPRRLKES